VVLHVGDSFTLAGFAQALKPRMKALGVRYEVRAETSSFTTTWSAKMDRLVADTQPDLVIINLGANEVLNTDPAAHAPAIRHIVQAIGGRPCVWVSAPSWRKDTGINDVIRQNSAPCRFFDSDSLVGQPIARQADHIHPTEQGGAVWADAFWTWLDGARTQAQDAGGRPTPWRLKPADPDEHRPRGDAAVSLSGR
jgi:lysophospholipase L1-like esterase